MFKTAKVCLIRVFVFPGPQSSAWPPALVSPPPPRPLPPICVYRPCPPICIYRPWPQICIYRLWPQIFIYQPWSVRSLGLHIPTLPPQFLFTGPGLRFLLPCSEFAFNLLIYSSSNGSSNISNSSNFLGLDNTNIRMPILVN